MGATVALRGMARRVGAGRALRLWYHRPLGLIRQSIAEGGPWQQQRTELGRREMIEAARRLPPLHERPADGGEMRVHFLTGRKYWYQTVFCFYSLQAVSPVRITPVIFDDGSFTDTVRGDIQRVTPWAAFRPYAEIEARLDDVLPGARFPALRARRLAYPHLRKLTDIHTSATGWSLVLDSDMLFFRRPDAVLEWLARPERPCYMQDCATSYGYSRALMAELAGGPVPEAVNVGLYGIDSTAIDWERLEYWCRVQLEREGADYLQEQGLTALLLAGKPATIFPPRDYVVKPPLDEGREPTAALHHYVAESKRSYFQHGWRRIIDGRP